MTCCASLSVRDMMAAMGDSKKKPPNILWICTDQQRYDTIHCLQNGQIHTPFLDRLCREGTAFTRAYCQSPVCTPSRASFLTGLYPSSVHVNTNGNQYFPDKVELITKRLADSGYTCGLSGKLHLASAFSGQEERTDDGYQVFHYSHSPHQHITPGNQYIQWLEEKGQDLDALFRVLGKNENGWTIRTYAEDIPAELHQTAWCAEKAIEFIQEGHRAPWLFSVNPFDPHPPYDAPRRYAERYDPAELPPPLFRESDLENQERLAGAYFQKKPAAPDHQVMRKKASYYGMIELIDEQVGRLLDALERTGQRENTVILYTSDHGDLLGDHGLMQKGCRFYEGAVHVPLVISWKGRFGEGAVCDELIELTDIAPTISEICGLDPGPVHGKSLLPILLGRKSAGRHRDYVRCEYYHALPYARTECVGETTNHATMYYDGRYKLIVYHNLEYGELYDLEKDPGEFDNLWDRKDCAERKLGLMKKSFDVSIVVCDPGPPVVAVY